MNSIRKNKLKLVAHRRQKFSLLLENVHDGHNIGAVLRTADQVGIFEIFLLYTDPILIRKNKSLLLGKRTSGGSRKWVDVYEFNDLKKCVTHLKSKYKWLLSSSVEGKDVKSLYNLDLAEDSVLAFGNEKTGISPALYAASDAKFTIPQMGMSQSLNISVAAAVSCYEALRQREELGYYSHAPNLNNTQRMSLEQEYIKRHFERQRVWKAKEL